MDLKHTTTVVAAVKAIPPERFWAKVRNTLLGLIFIAGAAYGADQWAWPWYVAVSVAVLGGFCISQDLTKKAISFLVGVIKDLLAAVRGKPEPPIPGP